MLVICDLVPFNIPLLSFPFFSIYNFIFDCYRQCCVLFRSFSSFFPVDCVAIPLAPCTFWLVLFAAFYCPLFRDNEHTFSKYANHYSLLNRDSLIQRNISEKMWNAIEEQLSEVCFLFGCIPRERKSFGVHFYLVSFWFPGKAHTNSVIPTMCEPSPTVCYSSERSSSIMY